VFHFREHITLLSMRRLYAFPFFFFLPIYLINLTLLGVKSRALHMLASVYHWSTPPNPSLFFFLTHGLAFPRPMLYHLYLTPDPFLFLISNLTFFGLSLGKKSSENYWQYQESKSWSPLGRHKRQYRDKKHQIPTEQGSEWEVSKGSKIRT
jgi:hypothetical protein